MKRKIYIPEQVSAYLDKAERRKTPLCCMIHSFCKCPLCRKKICRSHAVSVQDDIGFCKPCEKWLLAQHTDGKELA